MGTVTVKGIAIRSVLSLSQVESRFEALRWHELTPLVGRDEELELLVRRWRRVKECEGCVVLLSGEPGIGKSRLVAAFAERIANESHTRLQYFSSAKQSRHQPSRSSGSWAMRLASIATTTRPHGSIA
jgi:DNA-binding NtrC family response regulator